MKGEMDTFVAEFRQEALLDVIRIKLSPSTTLEPTQSKVGGLFYLSRTAKTPTDSKGKQLLFLTQINCEELSENTIYPGKGVVQLWIFSGNYDMGNDYDNPCSDENKRVIYYPIIEEHYGSGELAAIYRPQRGEDEEPITPIYINKPLPMPFQLERQWRTISDYRFQGVFIEKQNVCFPKKQTQNLWQLDEDLAELVCEMLDITKNTQIGGYGYFTQTDPRTYDSLLEYTEILLQLDSYEDNNGYEIIQGDYGIGDFFAVKEQLKKLDFTNCLYNWDHC